MGISTTKKKIMNPILKNILAIIMGWLGGSIVNIGLVELGHKVFPIAGVDFNDMDSLSTLMPTLDSTYFIFSVFSTRFRNFSWCFNCR